MFRRAPAGPQVGRAETEAPQVPLAAERRTDYAGGERGRKGPEIQGRLRLRVVAPGPGEKKVRAF